MEFLDQNMWLKFFVLILSSVITTQQLVGEETMKPVKVGGIQLIKLDNGFQVWTKRVGEGPIKILLLHGGPGYTHECFECFEDFFPRDQFQLIYYDQLGSHYSDQPDDASLWTIERFCDEVEQVRRALGLENYYLYGFSWGSMLAIEYALKHQNHLKGLILSNMTASAADYESYYNKLRNELPQKILKELEAYETSQSTDQPGYQQRLFEEFYAKYICRLDPWPEPLLRSVRHFNKSISDAIFGPDEFSVSGNCQQWDRWNSLNKIAVPTLLIGAHYDTINPKDIEKMGSLIPHSQVKICENGSHLAMYDDQEAYFDALLSFINDVENKQASETLKKSAR